MNTWIWIAIVVGVAIIAIIAIIAITRKKGRVSRRDLLSGVPAGYAPGFNY